VQPSGPPAAKKTKTESVTHSVNAPTQQQPDQLRVDTPQQSVKPRAQYRNTDLPAPVQADQRWTKKFLPTMLLWAGSQEEQLWNMLDAMLLEHIQLVFNAVYPELSLTVVQNGVVFSLVSSPSLFSFIIFDGCF
jgi:hypothetical protein